MENGYIFTSEVIDSDLTGFICSKDNEVSFGK